MNRTALLRGLVFFAATLTINVPAAFGHSDCWKEGPRWGRFTVCRPHVHSVPSLGDVKKGILGNLSMKIARDQRVVAQARGWTTVSCGVVGVPLFTAVGAAYHVPICAAVDLAAAGPWCTTFIGSSSTAIAGLTCAQLCADRHLADCR